VECCLVAGWIVDPSRNGLNLERVIRFNDSLNAGPRELLSRLSLTHVDRVKVQFGQVKCQIYDLHHSILLGLHLTFPRFRKNRPMFCSVAEVRQQGLS
jgi:hypothetical protein